MECKCNMTIKMVGDGCTICNPDLASEYNKTKIRDNIESLLLDLEGLAESRHDDLSIAKDAADLIREYNMINNMYNEKGGIKMQLDRKWINQPSQSQPLYKEHGKKVLAYKIDDKTSQIYYIEGSVISAIVPTLSLSDGWSPIR